MLPFVGVYTTTTTHGLLAITLPTVGAISILVLLSLVVIQPGRFTFPVNLTEVKAPVVAQLLLAQARIAGVAAYAVLDGDGNGSVTSVVAPTAAL